MAELKKGKNMIQFAFKSDRDDTRDTCVRSGRC